MTPHSPYRRAIQTTLLAVVEGDAEVQLFAHLRALYCSRGSGIAIQVVNAHGKGAANVVKLAARRKALGGHNVVSAICDADTDWGPHVERAAKKAGVRVMLANPCLEAELLDIAGIPLKKLSPKEAFRRSFGYQAHEKEVIARSFPQPMLDAARDRSAYLGALLALIGAPSPSQD